MKTALDEAMDDARHYHNMWKSAILREERLQEDIGSLHRHIEKLEAALLLERATRIVMTIANLGSEAAHTDRIMEQARAELAAERYFFAPKEPEPVGGPCQCDECRAERNRVL